MESEKETFEVNYLLSLSRMPDRFYNMVYEPQIAEQIKAASTPKKPAWFNPGTALRSLLVVSCLRRDTVVLQGEWLGVARECEQFSNSLVVLQTINESMMKSATDLTNQLTTQSMAVRTQLLQDVMELHQISQMVKMSFDALISIHDVGAQKLNTLTGPGITYRQAIFDLQDTIERIIEKLHSISPPPPTPQYA